MVKKIVQSGNFWIYVWLYQTGIFKTKLIQLTQLNTMVSTTMSLIIAVFLSDMFMKHF